MYAPASPAMPLNAENRARVIDGEADAGERTYALFTHLAGTLSLISGVPVIGPISALIMWRIRAKDSPFLDDHGREAVNFQLSQVAYFVGITVIGVLVSTLTFGVLSPLVFLVGVVAVPLLWVLNIVGCVRGAMAANKGEYYRYPACIRFITGDTK